MTLNIRDFGATGNGTTDDTTAIQSCLTVAGQQSSSFGLGAIVDVPPGTYLVSTSLTCTSNVVLRGVGPTDRAGAHLGAAAQLKAATSMAVPLLALSNANDVTISWLGFAGAGAVSGSVGLSAVNCSALTVRDCFFDQFGDQAITVSGSSGLACLLSNLYVQNSVLVRTGRSAYIGAMEALVQDPIIENCNINASISTASASTAMVGSVRLSVDRVRE